MADLEKEFDISREPSDYEPTAHIRRRVDERTMVDYDIIGEAIEDGEVTDVQPNDKGNNDAVIHYDWLNSTFKVVVSIEDQVIETAHEVES